MISLILATNKVGCIGYKNRLPWILKDDLAYFKRLTEGQNVVMGRRTFDSLGCKPLPNRNNYVLTSSHFFYKHITREENLHFIRYVNELPQNFFVIGGARMYEDFIQYADIVYLTAVNDEFWGDTFIKPTFFQTLASDFKRVSSLSNEFANKNNTHEFKIEVWSRYKPVTNPTSRM